MKAQTFFELGKFIYFYQLGFGVAT